jgi:GDPmannose 4,6-dehydratase
MSETPRCSALVTGASGQDGQYLCERLNRAGVAVHGVARADTVPERMAGMDGNVRWHCGALDDPHALAELLDSVAPEQIYHLAAPTHVAKSFEDPSAITLEIVASTQRLLEAIRLHAPGARLFYASSAEIFGEPDEVPQNEQTPLNPVSPYGAAKAFATHLTRIYREAYGLFCVNGILYNHESVRRGGEFVTRKICRAAAAISRGRQRTLALGNIDASRDWGYAPDYVEAMVRALAHDTPQDYIVATGVRRTVRDVLDAAFGAVGLNWSDYVVIDQMLFRPTEPTRLVGDATRAHKVLDWQPRTAFEAFIQEMTRVEVQRLPTGGQKE